MELKFILIRILKFCYTVLLLILFPSCAQCNFLELFLLPFFPLCFCSLAGGGGGGGGGGGALAGGGGVLPGGGGVLPGGGGGGGAFGG